MERMDYTPNSNRFKETNTLTQAADQNERKKLDKVISGTAKQKKAGLVAKLFNTFVQEDPSTIKDSLFRDVLVPAINKLIIDGVDRVFGGRGVSSKSQIPATRFSYSSISSPNYGYQSQNIQPYQVPSYNNIVLPSERDAKDVLIRMDELLSVYRVVSIADLYDLVGWQSQYTDQNYGWTNLSSASVVRVREGWLLKFPKAMQIN